MYVPIHQTNAALPTSSLYFKVAYLKQLDQMRPALTPSQRPEPRWMVDPNDYLKPMVYEPKNARWAKPVTATATTTKTDALDWGSRSTRFAGRPATHRRELLDDGIDQRSSSVWSPSPGGRSVRTLLAAAASMNVCASSMRRKRSSTRSIAALVTASTKPWWSW